MIYPNYIVVFDLETGNTSTEDPVVLEIAAIIVDPKSLKRVPEAEFSTLVIPDDWSKVTQGALDVNHIKKEEVYEKGIPEKDALFSFIEFCKTYAKNDNKWSRVIPAGHNIDGFDIPIMKNLCRKYKHVDKDGSVKLFHPTLTYDSLKDCHWWFESQGEPSKYNLDYLRDYFGISKDGAHRALKDVEDCADIMARFVNFRRTILQKAKPKFKGCFSGV